MTITTKEIVFVMVLGAFLFLVEHIIRKKMGL